MNSNTQFKDVLIALIKSIDLISFLLKHHHRRVGIIAYHLGLECKLDKQSLSNLVAAASLHDVGALSVKERDELIQLDISNPHPHAFLGGAMLSSFSYFKDISTIIKYHHWEWNFGENKYNDDEEVPFESYILHLADRIDILINKDDWILDQVDDIAKIIISKSGSTFNPDCVNAFIKISKLESFWLDIDTIFMEDLLKDALIDDEIDLNMDLLEELAYTFSRIIDFRSEYTLSHSSGMGVVASEIARLCGLGPEICTKVKIAGFLHDIGKIGVPNEILEKPGKLTKYEFNKIKAHPYYTQKILGNIKGFDEICKWASMHHEKKDGTGYPNHLTEEDFSIEVDILNCADKITALSENRPYREGLDSKKILELLNDGFSKVDNTQVLNIVNENIDLLIDLRKLSQSVAFKVYQNKNFVKSH